MRKAFLEGFLVCCFFSGCIASAEKIAETTNERIKVELLSQQDSCKIYIFYDGGRTRYFSTCEGSIQWVENCGKNCWRKVNIQTVVQ